MIANCMKFIEQKETDKLLQALWIHKGSLLKKWS